MGLFRGVSKAANEIVARAVARKFRSNAAKAVLALCLLSTLFGSAVLFSSSKPALQSTSAASGKPSGAALTDAQMAKMSSGQLAHYVFENHGCGGCHTLGANGKLGFTQRGTQIGKGFEGCISMLTSMSVIAQVKPTDRTEDQKHKAARFQEFGCNTCHQVGPGKLALTAYGTKLKSLHMACTDVENILSAQKK